MKLLDLKKGSVYFDKDFGEILIFLSNSEGHYYRFFNLGTNRFYLMYLTDEKNIGCWLELL